MNPATHELKTDPGVFAAEASNLKPYGMRRDDRGYEVGDHLLLRETQHTGEQMAQGAPLIYTGRESHKIVGHILRGPLYGLAEGWVILGYAPPAVLDDDALRALWRGAGGDFHGPNVETGTMPEELLLPLLRELSAGRPIRADLRLLQAGAMLRSSAELFREYERHHLAKGDGADTQARARRNAVIAGRIERLLVRLEDDLDASAHALVGAGEAWAPAKARAAREARR